MKKTLYLAFLSFLVPSLSFAAQKDKVTEGIYDMGGRKLIDRSVEVTGALQVDKWLELINESTPSTPAATHARFFYNNGQQKLCVVFGDGSQTCLGPGNAGGGGVFAGAIQPIVYNSTTNIISATLISLSTGVAYQLNQVNASTAIWNTAILQSGATFYVSSGTIQTGQITNYLDFQGVSSEPPMPSVGVARMHGITNNGISRLEQDDNNGLTDVVLGEDTVFIVRNNSNGNLTPLQVVYVNGATGNIPQVGLALSSTTAYMPGVAVVIDTVSNNGYTQVMKLGVINHVNTNAWNVGDILFVSSTSSGSLTNVRPSYPNYTDVIGTVLVKGIGNGSVLVNIPASMKGQENGTDQFMWTASTITTQAINNKYNLTTGTATIVGYEDFIAQSVNPPAPPAGVVRLHSATTQGFTRFEQDNEAPTNLVLGRDNVFIGKNTTGSTIPAGMVVYTTGSSGNIPTIGLAISSFPTNVTPLPMPAIGVTLDAITSGSFGQIMQTGIISNINTSAFTTGNVLYVSSVTAGAFTQTRPTPPAYVQGVARVLVSGVGNGSLEIIVAPFVGGQETGTNASAFKIQNSNTIDFLNSNGGSGATLSNPNGTGNANLEILGTLGVGINNPYTGTPGTPELVVSTQGWAVISSSQDNTTAYSGFQATSPIDQSVLWTLPKRDGGNGQVIKTNGSGNLSFDSSFALTASSESLMGSAGAYVTYGASLGSATLRNVASGTQCLHADASGNITGTGSDCNAGAGTLTSTQTWTGGNTFSSTVTITGVFLQPYNLYRRPVLQYLSTGTVTIETGLDGIAGDAVIIFPNGNKLTETQNKLYQSTTTRTANWGVLSSMQGGLRPTETLTNNTWLNYYVVMSSLTTDTTDFVLVASTWQPTQANYATLSGASPFFGTNNWVYVGVLPYGDNSGTANAILKFGMSGNRIALYNAVTSASGATARGVRLATTAGATSITWTYATGSLISSNQVPAQLGIGDFIFTMASSQLVQATDAANDNNIFYTNLSAATQSAFAVADVVLVAGFRSNTTGSTAQDIDLTSYLDNVLGVGANPQL